MSKKPPASPLRQSMAIQKERDLQRDLRVVVKGLEQSGESRALGKARVTQLKKLKGELDKASAKVQEMMGGLPPDPPELKAIKKAEKAKKKK